MTLRVQGWHVGDHVSLDWFERRDLEFGTDGGEVVVEVLQPRAECMNKIVRAVRDERDAHLLRVPVSAIVDVLDLVAARWMADDTPLRDEVERVLPRITGFSVEMVRNLLFGMMTQLTRSNLLALLEAELGDPAVLDGFVFGKDDVALRAKGRGLFLHVLGGGDPFLPILSLAQGMLTKSAALAKVSSAEPYLTAAFARSIAEVAPGLAASLAVISWAGSDREILGAALAEVDGVVAFGGERAIESITQACRPGTTVVAFGHRTSIAIVTSEVLAGGHTRDVAFRLARDLSLCDQRSCLAPQVVFLEDATGARAERFAHDLAAGLRDIWVDLPKGTTSVAERVSLCEWRDRYRFREFAGAGVVVADEDLRWIIAVDPEITLVPGPGGRTLRVCPIEGLDAVLAELEAANVVSSVGLASSPGRRLELAERLADAGVSRVCEIGDMLAPNGLWHQDGEFRLRRLVRWTDLEPARDWGPPW